MSEIVLIGLGVIMLFLLAVNNRRTAKRHIVMIGLATVVAVCVVVIHPYFSEPLLLSTPLDMWLKCGDSGLDVRELLFKKSMNISGPLGWDRVDVFQSKGNGFHKLVGGRPERVHSMDTNQQQPTKETNESRNKSGDGDVNQWFWLLAGIIPGIIFLIDALLYITKTSPGRGSGCIVLAMIVPQSVLLNFNAGRTRGFEYTPKCLSSIVVLAIPSHLVCYGLYLHHTTCPKCRCCGCRCCCQQN